VPEARSDSELVGASLDGDTAAFALLVRRHRPKVAAVVRRMLDDWGDAEDVAQEAVLHAYLGLDRLREPDRFAGWLCGIAVNVAKMRLRRPQRRWLSLEELTGGRRVPAAAEGAPDPSPEQALETLELFGVVQAAVDVLPPAQREVVLMHYVDGFSCQEIAALLGRSTGAVRVRLHRARTQLRDRLLPALAPRKEIPMLEVTIQDVVVRMAADDGESGDLRRIILLKEKDGGRVLPIWVGAAEGDALALQLASELMPRPMTADLMARLLEVSGSRVVHVAVSRLVEQTFYSVIAVEAGGRREEIDARPSDALNLAARVGAPVFVHEDVLGGSGIAAEDDRELMTRLDEDWEKHIGSLEPGEWRSLSPDLVKSLRDMT
jgi:RNA polymerase sigma factor (sigma-70 family)